MHLYRCELVLHDYLFWATTERGRLAETGPHIHNYALTYALGWATAPWSTDYHKPHYPEELAEAGQRYITPARLLDGSTALIQYNTMNERYRVPKKEKSLGYPEWGYTRCWRPESRYRCYVISAEPQVFPRFVRLGKFLAKTALHSESAVTLRLRHIVGEGPCVSLLNWTDLVPASCPVIYDVVSRALPTSLIDRAVFEDIPGTYLLATFQDQQTVTLPLAMGYYGRNTCASW
jgi:CRISPR-associated protein Csc1